MTGKKVEDEGVLGFLVKKERGFVYELFLDKPSNRLKGRRGSELFLGGFVWERRESRVERERLRVSG